MDLTKEQNDDIEAARRALSPTRRPTVSALEEILFQPFDVLDRGFIRVVDYMGDDTAVVQAARVSYGRGTRQVNEDRALIRYLMKHHHSTPFEMAEIKFHVKLPIFVARQWIRHRTASVNEYSARYSILDKEFYIPRPENLATQSTSNRQGRENVLDEAQASRILEILRDDAERNYRHYVWMLNEGSDGDPIDPNRLGLARELARMNLTLNSYTQWYWKTDLHNLFGFLNLRADQHAQYEIRVYAEEMMKMVERWVPHSYQAFLDYRLGAISLSAQAIKTIRGWVAGKAVTQESSGLSVREWNEIAEIFGPLSKPS